MSRTSESYQALIKDMQTMLRQQRDEIAALRHSIKRAKAVIQQRDLELSILVQLDTLDELHIGPPEITKSENA